MSKLKEWFLTKAVRIFCGWTGGGHGYFPGPIIKIAHTCYYFDYCEYCGKQKVVRADAKES